MKKNLKRLKFFFKIIKYLKKKKKKNPGNNESRLGFRGDTFVFERIIPSEEGGTRKPCDGLPLIGLMRYTHGLRGLHVRFVKVTCVTCAICAVHIVLHVQFVRCTFSYMCGL